MGFNERKLPEAPFALCRENLLMMIKANFLANKKRVKNNMSQKLLLLALGQSRPQVVL